jgi:hypothetical protein
MAERHAAPVLGRGVGDLPMKCDSAAATRAPPKDAFTNNVHELIYHFECQDGTEMHVTMLTASAPAVPAVL